MASQLELESALREAIAEIEALQATMAASSEPIAVVGIGCRLPAGGNTASAVWQALSAGAPLTRSPPVTRADIAAIYDPDPDQEDKSTCEQGGYLDGIEQFDAEFFRMLPQQAVALDPQQRLLLESAWNAIEDAGIDPHSLKGARTGVFVGLSFDDYAARFQGSPSGQDPAVSLGNARSLAAGRLSYFFDFKGPSIQLDTACSSSAVAIHQAVRSLRSGECDLALAGGANAIIDPETMVRLSKMKAISPDGRCRSFDDRADGYGRGEGAILFLLARLSVAHQKGMRIHAVVRGTAVNHDGASNGLTAPNGDAQVEVVLAALADAEVTPHAIAFVEAHGTGTPLGDPIEASALKRVFAEQPSGSVLLASSKAVYGHLEAAAGAMGMLSAMLALDQGILPGQPADTVPSHRIDWANMPLKLAVGATPINAARRCAGISSFGMSGTNVHIVLEKAPLASPREGRPAGLALLSAHSAPALRQRARDLAEWLEARPQITLVDIERSLLARAGLAHRAVFLLEDHEQLIAALYAFAQGKDHSALAHGVAPRGATPSAITQLEDKDGVCAAYLAGADITPRVVAGHPGHLVSLPDYPFQRLTYWQESAQSRYKHDEKSGASPEMWETGRAVQGVEAIAKDLRTLLADMLELPEAAIGDDVPFIEIGADSLILLDAVRLIEQRYGLSIAMGDLFGGLSTIAALAMHIDGNCVTADPKESTTLGIETSPAPMVSEPAASAKIDATAGSAYFTDLVARFAERHAGSKAKADANRQAMADSRRAVGFRPSFKEALFPIVGARSEGAYIWDVDGNRFVDTAMGFGVYLFGHRYAPIEAAIDEARVAGRPIGPQSSDAGPVAELLCRLTRFDRIAFCNTGTEAIMTALRLARAGTGRSAVALFSGSYHGHFDGVLGASGGSLGAVPAAPGVTSAFVSELLVLDYGAESALDAIEKHGSQLAAVLVEPVQSRAPGLQPVEFLSRLRQLADRHGFALVFDEVLTGLRVHPQGAHGLFGVKPDIATYGKILGGGLPIGAVAGSARFLDGIDGGSWAYGDDSAPTAERVFFGGTFNKNALSMAAARAVLEELEREGPALQQRLNDRTDAMVSRLIAGIQAEDLPVNVQHFGSLWRFGFLSNPDAFYLELANRGVYVWEGRNCFLSTGHDDAEIDQIVDASLDSLRAMRRAGMLEGHAPAASSPVRLSKLPLDMAEDTAVRLVPPPSVARKIKKKGLPILSDNALVRGRLLDAAATAFAAEALGTLLDGQSREFELSELQDRYGMSLAARGLIGSMASWLQADGLLIAGDGKLSFAAPCDTVSALTALDEVRGMDGTAEADLLALAGLGLADVLAGHKHPLEVLAPRGDFTRLAAIYAIPELARATNELFAEGCAALVANVPHDRAIRILEWGAGTGSATGPLLAAMGDRPLRYHATDASTAFFDPARWRYPDSRLSFGRYDIEQSAAEQGLAAGSFDLIVASNIVHVARNLDFVLDQAARLLSPGGVLALHELTRTPRWLHMIFGLTDGWWQHDDAWRGSESPLLNVEKWQQALVDAGLAVTASFAAQVNDGGDSGAAVILGRKNTLASATRAQQELVALATVDAEAGQAYNLALCVELHGEIDYARLACAIDAEAVANDALCATFTDDPIAMAFDASYPATCEIVHVSDGEEALEVQCSAFADAPFDLFGGPLFRSRILRLRDDLSRVILSAPHVVADAMSLTLIWEGAVRRYDGTGVVPRPSFADHLAKEHSWLESAEADNLREFWDGRVPASPAYRHSGWDGALHQNRFGDAIVRAARKRASTCGMTPFMLHCAAFALAARAHNPKLAAVGIPVSGRSRAAEGLVGYCTHIVPITLPPSEGLSISDYLARFRSELVDAYAHQALPFAEMPRKGLPHIEATFNLDAGGLSAPAGAKARPVGWQTRHEPFPLRVNLTGDGEDLVVEVGYQTAVHRSEDVVGIIESYHWFLERIVEDDPSKPLPMRVVFLPDLSLVSTVKSATELVPADDDALLSDVETHLANAIKQALNLDSVKPHDDFFALGGDSIVSMQVAAAARRNGLVVEARWVLEHRTVRAIARHAASVGPAVAQPSQGERSDDVRLLADDEMAAVLSLFED